MCKIRETPNLTRYADLQDPNVTKGEASQVHLSLRSEHIYIHTWAIYVQSGNLVSIGPAKLSILQEMEHYAEVILDLIDC